MKTDIQTLKDLFKTSYDVYVDSREEAALITDAYHNRQYTQSQLATLENRGQPAETFNVIKLFSNMLLGYYSTVVNTVKVSPKQYSDIPTASLLNDLANTVLSTNNFEIEGDKVKLDGLLSGVMCSYIEVVDTKEVDQFGRKIREIKVTHVPQAEIVIDPLSRLESYEDGRFVHRWKWVSEDTLKRMFKNKKSVIEKLEAYNNHLDIPDSEFEQTYNTQFNGLFKVFNNYLLVHTVIKDDDDRVWSIYWCDDYELSREEVTYREVTFPYRIQKLYYSNKAEYYGVFREVIESQKAINQALLKIQLMANTQKIFLEKGAVENLADFTNQVNRVNAIVPMLSLKKMRIETMNKEIADQYIIIDRAFNRIQKILGVNDSFLGMAFASDSGRKVKLQQNQTTMSLRPITTKFSQFYRLLGWDIVNLAKQYYTATQALKIADETVGARWIELNKPMTMWTGQFDENGQPIMDFVYEEVLDPATGKPEIDENGNIVVAPVPTGETEIAFTEVDIEIDSVAYNDEDEKNQLMVETILQGNIGAMLSSVNPAGFLQAASLAVKSMKTKHSPEISDIIAQTAQMLAQTGQQPAPVSARDQPKSQALKLPQNTNEGY